MVNWSGKMYDKIMAQKTLIYKFKTLTAEKTTPRHTIIKLLKIKDKEKILSEKKGTFYTRELEYK